MTVTDRDERPHPPGDGPGWGEAWSFVFADPADPTDGGALRGFVHLALIPARQTCWYWSALLGPGRDPVVVADPEVPPPQAPGTLEVRAHGLWAEHYVEEPFDHVSVGCEAFALRLDPEDLATAQRGGQLLGERVPYGLDLGWETTGPLTGTERGYRLDCRVVGEVLVGDERLELDVPGWREHRWGPTGWWPSGADDPGAAAFTFPTD